MIGSFAFLFSIGFSVKFTLCRKTINSQNFDEQLELFILDPNPGTIDVDDMDTDIESQRRCLMAFRKIANERKYETSLSIELSSPLKFLETILKEIEGRACIRQLNLEGTPDMLNLAVISKALTQPYCPIEALSFVIGPHEHFLPLAQALQLNRTISNLKINYSMSFYGLKMLEPIFQALTCIPLTGAENPANSSVQTLHLVGFDIPKTEAEALNRMLEKNQSITKLSFTDSDFSDFFRLQAGLVNNKRLSVLSLKRCMVSSGDLVKIVSYLPPHLEVLNLSNLRGFVSEEDLIKDLINLIKECKKRKLSLHIIFNGNNLWNEFGCREELKELLLSSGDEFNVSLECDDLKEILVYKQNQYATFFEVLAKAYDAGDSQIQPPTPISGNVFN